MSLLKLTDSRKVPVMSFNLFNGNTETYEGQDLGLHPRRSSRTIRVALPGIPLIAIDD